MELFVGEAPRELTQLEHWGCPWSREPSGHVAVRPFGGMERERTWYAADKTGFHMLHVLYQTSLKYEWFRRPERHVGRAENRPAEEQKIDQQKSRK